jgi:predicted branched-subunit amino acid permease
MTVSTPLWRHPEFAVGVREMRAIALGIGAWGLVAGIAMSKAGLGAALAIAMSLFVFAGSALLAALPLMVQGAPLWVIWATAFCVNLRFVIFSAGWRPYFESLSRPRRLLVTYFTVDFTYIAFMRRFPRPGDVRAQLAYVAGNATVSWAAWQVTTIAGVVLADVIPTRWGLGFAGSLALLGITATLLVDRGTWIAAAVAACAAFAAFALPFHLNIVVAIAAAMAVGVLVDHVAPPRSVPAATPSATETEDAA